MLSSWTIPSVPAESSVMPTTTAVVLALLGKLVSSPFNNRSRLTLSSDLRAVMSARRSLESSMVSPLAKRVFSFKSATQILLLRRTSSVSLQNAANSELTSTTSVPTALLLNFLPSLLPCHLRSFLELLKLAAISLWHLGLRAVAPGSERMLLGKLLLPSLATLSTNPIYSSIDNGPYFKDIDRQVKTEPDSSKSKEKYDLRCMPPQACKY